MQRVHWVQAFRFIAIVGYKGPVDLQFFDPLNCIACAMLIWTRMTAVTKQIGEAMYRIKHGLFDVLLRQQLKIPGVSIALA